MSNETTNNFSLIKLPEIPESVDNTVKNLTDKPSHNIGDTIGDLWYLVFGGISHAADKRKMKYAHELENYKAELEKSIEEIPLEKRIEPSVQVTAQALENSKYCVESKELRDMFTNLISNSMNIDYQQYVHPSFAEMIKQMSPLDAMVLKMFKKNLNTTFPICDYHLHSGKGSGYNVVAEKVLLNGPSNNITATANSLTSLERFGLVSIPQGIYLTDAEVYKPFEEHPLFHMLKSMYEDKGNIQVKKKAVYLTPLGKSFVNLCIAD